MRFWRLTLGFGLLGSLSAAIAGGVMWTDTCSSSDSLQILCFSRGDVMVFGGFFGLVLGAALGVVVWALWRLASWWIGFGYDKPGGEPNAYKREQV